MSDEDQSLAEVDSAQATEVTATPVPAENELPETTDEQTDETVKDERTFTQEELDAAVGKRLARERRKWEREQHSQQAAMPEVPSEIPSADQFESPQHYAEFIRAEAQKLIQQKEAWERQTQITESYNDRAEEAREKYDDFDQVAHGNHWLPSDAMVEAIQASDIGPDVAYHLGSNPKEAARIAKLSPFLQAKEIGKIEAKLADNPPTKRMSSAPEPIKPVASRNSSSGVVDTTDPRSTQNMSTSDWIEAERQRQIAKARAARDR